MKPYNRASHPNRIWLLKAINIGRSIEVSRENCKFGENHEVRPEIRNSWMSGWVSTEDNHDCNSRIRRCRRDDAELEGHCKIWVVSSLEKGQSGYWEDIRCFLLTMTLPVAVSP